MSWDLDTDSLSEEELDEELGDGLDDLDALIACIMEGVEDGESVDILDLRRVKEMQLAHQLLKRYVHGLDVSVSCNLHDPFHFMGNIRVEGEMVEFNDPRWFVRVACLASNTEVYPLAKNRVRMTFTFHGLTRTIA